jgi:hypothetical protein
MWKHFLVRGSDMHKSFARKESSILDEFEEMEEKNSAWDKVWETEKQVITQGLTGHFKIIVSVLIGLGNFTQFKKHCKVS